MLKIILDTNLIVSGLISPDGYSSKILIHTIHKKKNILCLSNEILEEYINVLNRPKFSKYPSFILQAESIIAHIHNYAKFFSPTQKIHILQDESDNKFLDLAIKSEADFIITGNINDFTIEKFEAVQKALKDVEKRGNSVKRISFFSVKFVY